MSATNAPYGFICAKHPSGQSRANEYQITSAYAANIFTGDPVKLVTTGTIELATSDGTRTGTVDGIEVLEIQRHQERGLAADGADLVIQLFERADGAGGEDEVGAFLRVSNGDGAADAAAGSGHQTDAAGERSVRRAHAGWASSESWAATMPPSWSVRAVG